MLADSTTIIEYLEERNPELPRLLPLSVADRARARWLEEYADTRMGDVLVWNYYNQLVIKRFVWRLPPDEAVVQRARDVEIPSILDYLEHDVVPPTPRFLFYTGADDADPALSVADIAIASMFRTAQFARYTIDGNRWPRTASYVRHVLAHPSFARLRDWEDLSLRTPISQHRLALQQHGAPISADTVGTDTPVHGITSRV